MRNSWVKKILDIVDAILRDLSQYALIDEKNCLQRIENAIPSRTETSTLAPEKKPISCALLTTCDQQFGGLDPATLRLLIRDLEKESLALQREIDDEEDAEKKKKLNEEFANMEELKKILRVLEAEALRRGKRPKIARCINI